MPSIDVEWTNRCEKKNTSSMYRSILIFYSLWNFFFLQHIIVGSMLERGKSRSEISLHGSDTTQDVTIWINRSYQCTNLELLNTSKLIVYTCYSRWSALYQGSHHYHSLRYLQRTNRRWPQCQKHVCEHKAYRVRTRFRQFQLSCLPLTNESTKQISTGGQHVAPHDFTTSKPLRLTSKTISIFISAGALTDQSNSGGAARDDGQSVRGDQSIGKPWLQTHTTNTQIEISSSRRVRVAQSKSLRKQINDVSTTGKCNCPIIWQGGEKPRMRIYESSHFRMGKFVQKSNQPRLNLISTKKCCP